MATSTLLAFYPGDLVEVKTRGSKTRQRIKSYYPRDSYVTLMGERTQSHAGFAECSDVRLVRRGNHFKWEFGMHDQLEFHDYLEEAHFWNSLDMMHEVRNPADGLFYTWTIEQAIDALESGIAHAFFYSSGHPGLPFDQVFFGGYTFENPEVNERMRQASLKQLREQQRNGVEAK